MEPDISESQQDGGSSSDTEAHTKGKGGRDAMKLRSMFARISREQLVGRRVGQRDGRVDGRRIAF